jgi:hypothetical protein
MPKSFVDFIYQRLLSEVTDSGPEAPAPGQDTAAEKKQKVKNVQTTFKQARETLAQMVDDRFGELEQQLTRSFGSQNKIDAVDRQKIVQVLGKIADKINSWGDADVQHASPEAERVPARPPMPVAAESMRRIDGLLIEAEIYVEENGHAMKIASVRSYLQQVKAEIMKQIDATLASLQNDAVMKLMQDIHSSVSNVHNIVSGQTPLNANEKMNAYHSLQQLGNVMAMTGGPKLKWGERLPKMNTPVQIYQAANGYPLVFDPSDRASILTALGKLKNPRSVKIKVGDSVETVDVSNQQQMADIISRAEEAMAQGGAQMAAAEKLAARPDRKLKLREPKPKPQMPVALGPGVGGGVEEV